MSVRLFLNRFQFAVLVVGILLLTPSCKDKEQGFDASGVFEAEEVLISSESTGRILLMRADEGQTVVPRQLLAQLDTTQLLLRRTQLEAQTRAIRSRHPDQNKQLAALEQQLLAAKREQQRIIPLVEVGGANAKQLDDLNAQIAVIEKQIAASRSSMQLTTQSYSHEEEALRIQISQTDDQISRCRITAPVAGTLLQRYAEPGELAVAGRTLFKLADLRRMELRAYVTANQLSELKLGQKVKVWSDQGEKEYKEHAGVVSWISQKAEFTPKTILTRNERAHQVYALKVIVPNDGTLKIGMYGQLSFHP